MPDTTSISPKAACGFLCSGTARGSLCARVAALVLAVSLCGFLALYLAATTPGKFSGWRNALPTTGMSATDAGGAYLRALYLHEAQIRPQLIRAGLFSPQDVADGNEQAWYAHDREHQGTSDVLVKTLWTMRAFPEVHDALLGLLLDETRAPGERIHEFFLYGACLAAIADALSWNDSSSFHLANYYDGRHIGLEEPDMLFRWFNYYNADPRLNITSEHDLFSAKRYESSPKAETGAERTEKLDIARRALPMILKDAQAEMAARAAHAPKDAGEQHTAKKVRGTRRDMAEYLEDFSHSASRAVLALWENRANPGFFALAKELLLSGQGSLKERYDSIPLMAEKPGLSVAEYAFRQKHAQDLALVTSCVGTSPRHYAYILGCMDDLIPATTNMLKAQGTFLLGGQTGPGVVMTRTGAFAPAKNLSGKLYLLADMGLAMEDAPEYDLSRARPIFQGMLFRHMVNQPLVLPLNPQNPKDAAVIQWYAEKGWEKGHTLLFSAVGSPEEVARHWGTLHLVWWPNEEEPGGEPDLAYFRPVSGHFMTGVLPQIKGAAVQRFLGPVTGLWFGRWNVDKTGWVVERYEARPEEAPRPAAAPAKPLRSPLLDWFTGEKPETAATTAAAPALPPTILPDKDLLKKSGAVYSHNYKITLARSLDEQFHDPSSSPISVFSFVDNAVTMMQEWNMDRDEHVRPATMYLWQFRADPAMEKRVRDILSQEDMSPYERLRKVRRALGLPETTKGEKGC